MRWRVTTNTYKPPVTALRSRAEEALCRKPLPADADAGPAGVARLLHALQVHQIELEMQSDTLKNARDAAEESAARHAELYDFAPVGVRACGAQIQYFFCGRHLLLASSPHAIW